jgi:hypothetical protein
LRFILKLGLSYRSVVRHIEIGFLSEEGLSLLADHFEIPPESVWELAVEAILRPRPPPGQFDSQIISEFPAIFAEFSRKQFKLLWQGSRDGFSASQFHGRWDGHANTLTLILERERNIFGGFTPVKWESPESNGNGWKENNCVKADDSQKSLIFTLKNRHNIGERRFAQKADEKCWAIDSGANCGPPFGCYRCDICFSNHCNARIGSHSWDLGQTSANDTGLDGRTFFAGSESFQVKESEVFEIRN